jgi:ankyrin repeat protein
MKLNYITLSSFTLALTCTLQGMSIDKQLTQATQQQDISRVRQLLQAAHTSVENYKLQGIDYQLISAAYNGDRALVKKSLERGASINNAKDSLGNTALWHAVDQGHTQVIQLLLEHRADFNCKNNTEHSPLQLALDRDRQDILNLFFKACSHMDFSTIDQLRTYNPHYYTSPNNSALHVAAYNGNAHVVQLLLDNGFDVNFIDRYGKAALHYAAQNGHTQVVELLLSHKATIDQTILGSYRDNFNATPLHLAAKAGQTATVELLLKSRATTNAQATLLDYTPLHYVSEINNQEQANQIIKLLLNYGADINAINKGKETPLYHALDKRRIDIAALLLRNGADVNIQQGPFKCTPLHLVLECMPEPNKKKLITLLLAHGADLALQDYQRKTPLQLIDTDDERNREISIQLEHYQRILQQTQQHYPKAHILKKAIKHGYYSVVKLLLQKGIKPTVKHLTLTKSYYDQEPDTLRKTIYKLIGQALLAHLRLIGELQAPQEQKPALPEQDTQPNLYGPISKTGIVGTYGLTKDLVHHIASFTQ